MDFRRVSPLQIGQKIRTVLDGTRQVAKNTRTGKPIDGGGWKLTGNKSIDQTTAATAARQAEHINNAWDRKHGRM